MVRESRHLLIASLPAALVGVSNLGRQVQPFSSADSDDWQLALIAGLSPSSGPVAALLAGSILWVPLLAGLLIVALGWSIIFARWRNRPVDPIWIPAAWLFSLMLPATVPFGFAAVALSFGLLFGCHTFGGSHRYLINPALLAITFLAISYPLIVSTGNWVPGSDAHTTWSVVAPNIAVAPDLALVSVFLGNEVGPIGTASAAACLVGAGYLVAVRLAPLRIVLGGALTLAALGWVAGQLWLWHFAAGNYLFALAFIATDPTTQPSTKAGLWAYGALFGALTFLLRTANPDHPEGSWAALLVASLFVPLLDYTSRKIGKLDQRTAGA